MTYKHLTIDEMTMIESYYLQENKPVEIANRMGRAIQTMDRLHLYRQKK